VPLQQVDDAVSRILYKKFELGLFDDPCKFSDALRELAVMHDPAHRQAALTMAQKSMVLLKNDAHLLPLKTNL
jgi:beta-glucosidase